MFSLRLRFRIAMHVIMVSLNVKNDLCLLRWISSDRANPLPVGSNPSSGWLKCVQKLCAGSQRGAWDVHIFSPTPAKSALRQSSLFICKNVIFQMWSGWRWLAQRLKGSADGYTKCFHSSDLAFSSGASHSSSSRQREPGNMGREKRIPKAVDLLWKSWAGYVRNTGESFKMKRFVISFMFKD